MKLELDSQEQEFLCNLLRQHHAQVLWELARTDHRSFKCTLREELNIIERVLERVQVFDTAFNCME